MSEDPSALLPPGLAADVERVTGASITAILTRSGGGASREGAELSLRWPDGREDQAYMNYDVLRAGAGDDAAFRREAAILRALSGPLKDAGVRTARFIAALPERRALLAERVAGEANYNRLRDPAQRSIVAADYMAQIAALHAIDVHACPIADMGVPQPIADMIRDRIAALRARNRAAGDDPLITVTLDWLEANVPAEPDRLAIVHGDAGPGNFIFADGRVSALLDWELVHYGDPMADIAMLWIRTLFQPFVPMPEAIAAYEAAGGVPVDRARVRFWQIFFEAGFAFTSRYDDPSAPPPPNLGMNMIYTTIHRKVLAGSLAAAAGISLPEVALPDAPPGPRERSFTLALDDLRGVIVPRLADEQASAKAKGLARLVKWWRDNERYGPAWQACEVEELSAALGTPFASVEQGRIAFVEALAEGSISQEKAIALCHAAALRSAALMADAMGGLSRSSLGPLQ
ncbi:phosphotransferase family protein [Sphingobium sp. Sx8-8]|uniref:phosphotransferase family protein n=1 Tax=Sphingobium sp. Sx8-8 TaxID=2933617 RepID=UPI001F582D95|nr:phosphotransferase family protein [Sphingobium sp. Sx8-8]